MYQSHDINDHHHQQQQGFQSKPTNLVSYKNHKTSPIQVNNVAAKRLKLPSSSLSFMVDEEKGGGGNIDESLRPLNLRTRRAACKVALRIEEDPTRRNVTDYPRRYSEIDSPRKYYESLMVKRHQSFEMKEKVKLSVSLPKREVEEDFLEIVRIRQARRPRIVQKYLDSIFPGLWLAEITPYTYKAHEVPAS